MWKGSSFSVCRTLGKEWKWRQSVLCFPVHSFFFFVCPLLRCFVHAVCPYHIEGVLRSFCQSSYIKSYFQDSVNLTGNVSSRLSWCFSQRTLRLFALSNRFYLHFVTVFHFVSMETDSNTISLPPTNLLSYLHSPSLCCLLAKVLP